MEIDEQLRSASDQMLEAIEQLRALEAEKRAIAPSSRRFQKLAREIERLADTLVTHAEEQSELGAEAALRHAESGEVVAPIAETPRDVTTILAEWRDAERRSSVTDPGSADGEAARDGTRMPAATGIAKTL